MVGSSHISKAPEAETMGMLLTVMLVVFVVLAVVCGASWLIDRTASRDDAQIR